MQDWRIRSGFVIGLVGAAALMAATSRWAPSPPETVPRHGPILSECDGAVSELVIQYVPEAANIVEAAYRDVLRQLPAGVTVHVLCPDRAAFGDLRRRVGPTKCRLVPVPTGHAMTCWSRDRWVALAPDGRGGATVLVAPREETGAGVWPERKGDESVADDLAAALPGCARSHRSALGFDGGDFCADSETVFVTPAVAARNIGGAVASDAELEAALSGLLGRKAILLRDAPDHHAAMFMMFAGGRRVLVGDPSMARKLLPAGGPLEDADFSEETQRRFDAVAARCAELGYRVTRIPLVPGRDARTYLTYVNVIIDERAGTRAVYMPVYRGAEVLNDAAEPVWRGLGFEVRRVDCTAAFRHFGALHCLVNVLARTPQAGS